MREYAKVNRIVSEFMNLFDDYEINKYQMDLSIATDKQSTSVIKFDGKKTGIFAAGVAFGTAGIKILTSKDAKKLYTNCTAAVLRAKACVMKTASAIQENAEDIYAEAQQINEDRAAAEEVVEDTAEEVTDFREETEETTEEGSEE